MYCDSCNKKYPDGTLFCSECGQKLKEQEEEKKTGQPEAEAKTKDDLKTEPEEKPKQETPPKTQAPPPPQQQTPPPQQQKAPPPQQPQQAPPQSQAAVQQQPGYAAPQGAQDPRREPLSLGFYFVYPILMSIPILNIVLVFMWAFGRDVNVNKKRIAIAILLWFVLMIAITVLLGTVVLSSFDDLWTLISDLF